MGAGMTILCDDANGCAYLSEGCPAEIADAQQLAITHAPRVFHADHRSYQSVVGPHTQRREIVDPLVEIRAANTMRRKYALNDCLNGLLNRAGLIVREYVLSHVAESTP